MANNHVKAELNIVYWNANSLLNKLQELPYLLNKYNMDILLLNETKFTNKNKCYLPGYTCVMSK